MALSKWWHKLTQRQSKASRYEQNNSPLRRTKWNRLALERLEDRLAPASALTYTIPAGGPHAVTL
jgi:hypothetical protein